MELDLINLIPPTKTPEKCSLDMLIQQTNKSIAPKSLFAQKCVRGWWPCAMEEDGKKVLTVSKEYSKAETKTLTVQMNTFWPSYCYTDAHPIVQQHIVPIDYIFFIVVDSYQNYCLG